MRSCARLSCASLNPEYSIAIICLPSTKRPTAHGAPIMSASFMPIRDAAITPLASRVVIRDDIAGTRLIASADVNTAGILIIGVMYERSTINAPSDWLFVKPVDSSIRVIMALSIMLVIGIIDAPIVTGTAMRMRLERTYLNPIGRKLLRTDICAANFFLFVL